MENGFSRELGVVVDESVLICHRKFRNSNSTVVACWGVALDCPCQTWALRLLGLPLRNSPSTRKTCSLGSLMQLRCRVWLSDLTPTAGRLHSKHPALSNCAPADRFLQRSRSSLTRPFSSCQCLLQRGTRGIGLSRGNDCGLKRRQTGRSPSLRLEANRVFLGVWDSQHHPESHVDFEREHGEHSSLRPWLSVAASRRCELPPTAISLTWDVGRARSVPTLLAHRSLAWHQKADQGG